MPLPLTYCLAMVAEITLVALVIVRTWRRRSVTIQSPRTEDEAFKRANNLFRHVAGEKAWQEVTRDGYVTVRSKVSPQHYYQIGPHGLRVLYLNRFVVNSGCVTTRPVYYEKSGHVMIFPFPPYDLLLTLWVLAHYDEARLVRTANWIYPEENLPGQINR